MNLTTTATLTQNVTQSIPYMVRPTDVAYLQANGTDFCSSFIGNVTSSSIQNLCIASSSAPTTVTGTTTAIVTSTSTYTQDYRINYVQYFTKVTTVQWKRDALASAGQIQERQQMPASTASVATPLSVLGWPACLISAACAQLSSVVVTTTTTLPTTIASVTATSILVATATCVPPTLDTYNSYFSFNPISEVVTIMGVSWSGASPSQFSGYVPYSMTSQITLPFPVCFAGICNTVVTVAVDSSVKWVDSQTSVAVQLFAYAGRDGGLQVTAGYQGVFYRIAGVSGSRSLVIAWYTSTVTYAEELSESDTLSEFPQASVALTNPSGVALGHFTITIFEGLPFVLYKYYDTGLNRYQAPGDPPSGGGSASVRVSKFSTVLEESRPLLRTSP
ncbi:hypothetical protein LTS10_002195 [Elasticomyces elasticus]|nr:hypothetical protein LTS10_002195 [Elasticomyces elasticus]